MIRFVIGCTLQIACFVCLMFTRINGQQWEYTNVDSLIAPATHIKIRLDSDDRPYLLYYLGQTHTAKLALIINLNHSMLYVFSRSVSSRSTPTPKARG
jgi:hypothetical protein